MIFYAIKNIEVFMQVLIEDIEQKILYHHVYLTKIVDTNLLRKMTWMQPTVSVTAVST